MRSTSTKDSISGTIEAMNTAAHELPEVSGTVEHRQSLSH